MSLGRTRCDLSVVSGDLLRASDNPLTYGSTSVDLISGDGSFVAVCFFVFVMFFTNENGLPLEQELMRGVSFLKRLLMVEL